KHQLRAAAAAIGITYEQLTGDLSGVNYSSIRAGTLEFRRFCESVQHLVMIRQFCRPIMDAFLRHVHASGVMDLPGYEEDPRPYHHVEWQPPGWAWVDPLKDAQGALMLLNAKLRSRTSIVAEHGEDFFDVANEIAEEEAFMRARGISPDAPGAKPTSIVKDDSEGDE